MIQWEYISRLILESAFQEGSLKEEEYLNDYGQKGWELCAISVSKTCRRYYFKRQITKNK